MRLISKNLPTTYGNSEFLSVDRVNELIKSLNISNNKLNGRIQNKIEHLQHFHKRIWIAVALFIVNIFLLTGWVNSYNNIAQFRANDYKYRALKNVRNERLIKLLNGIDSLTNSIPNILKRL